MIGCLRRFVILFKNKLQVFFSVPALFTLYIGRIALDDESS